MTYEKHNDTLGVRVPQLDMRNLISPARLIMLMRRNQVKVIRRASNGQCLLIEFDSMPENLKQQVVNKFGKPNI